MTHDPPATTMTEPLSPYQRSMLAQVQRVERALSTATSERRVNTVWEYTQSAIAVFVVLTTCGGVIALSTWDADARLPPEWWTIVGLVVGFYFGRVRPPTRSGLERDRATDDHKPRKENRDA